MVINFIGNFANGYVGEISDESHLAKELENLGHVVNKVNRDEWKAFVDGETVQQDWNLPIDADINIVAKWYHFDSADYITELRKLANSPVFYWVWDYMLDPNFADWHLNTAQAADLYLSGELGLAPAYRANGIKFYYFQFDVCDGSIPVIKTHKDIDVLFTGSCIEQGDRIEWLKKINEKFHVVIFGWGHEKWTELGFEAYAPVYGEEYNRLIARSKITLGFSVEPHCFGYWSNRVGKVIKAGGFLLQQYTPGMEQRLPGLGVDYFSSPEEAIEEIEAYLRINNFPQYYDRDDEEFTSFRKTRQLEILMEIFIKEDNGKDWLLP